MASRDYGAGIAPALISLSQGTCYYPGCGQPVIVLVEGEPSMNLEIAHIIGLNKNSARYEEEPGWTPDQRNEFRNLILLCKPHHKRVDSTRTRQKYKAAKLRQWKKSVETQGQDILNAFRYPTDELLEASITNAMNNEVAVVKSSLADLERTNKTLAQAVERLLGSAGDYQLIGNYLDADQASILNEVGRNLRFALDPETINTLDAASKNLRHIDKEFVEDLNSAAQALREARGDM